MNTADLISRARRSAFIDTGAVDWTDAIILEELNDQLTQLYVNAVVTADQGHWQMTDYALLVANQRAYRLPERACAGSVQRFQLSSTSSVDWSELAEIPEADALRYEYSTEELPLRCAVRGESVVMLPPARTSGRVFRTIYQIRPSRMTAAQASSAGLITNISGRVLTLSAATNSVSTAGTQTPQTTGTVSVDIVHPEGWHSVQWTGTATFSNSGQTVTLASHASGLAEADDLSMIRVGDYVRIANQTDWPALPYEFHRSLADAVAVKILTMKGMSQKAQDLAQAHVVPDLKRFGNLLEPRVTSAAFTMVAPEFA